MSSSLTLQFDEAMLGIYQGALSEAHYNAGFFLQMLHEHGGLQTARLLIHKERVSDGYTALYLRGRLDLTVEALIHDNAKWHPLFTETELQICASRLQEYGYPGVHSAA
jgi:hypothetical protein